MSTTMRAVRAAADAVRGDRAAAARGLRRAAPPPPAPGGLDADRVRAAVEELRPAVDPRDVDLVLAIALRRLGHDARLVLGREHAPRNRAAECAVWVEVDGRVVSTTEPVHEVFRVLARLPGGDR